jgi:hypothetical protein
VTPASPDVAIAAVLPAALELILPERLNSAVTFRPFVVGQPSGERDPAPCGEIASTPSSPVFRVGGERGAGQPRPTTTAPPR